MTTETVTLEEVFRHVTVRPGTWNGNMVQGKGRWYLSDGVALFRAARLDEERAREMEVCKPKTGVDESGFVKEADAKRVLGDAVARATIEVGPQPDAWGRDDFRRPVIRFDIPDGRVAFDAWRGSTRHSPYPRRTPHRFPPEGPGRFLEGRRSSCRPDAATPGPLSAQRLLLE